MLQRSAFKFLYLAPERFFLAAPEEQHLLNALRPAYLVVDEAHCIDRWGRDFRPEYGRLAEVCRRLGNPPVLALTAAPSRQTQARILWSLGVPNADVVVEGGDRPNIALLRLSVSVAQRHIMVASLLRLAEALGIKAMVFVPTRKIGKELLQHLSADALPTPFFHGQLSALSKDSLLQRFGGRLEPPLSRIVCTNAFGMGIDVPDVRMVIHWQHPASADEYLQEFGRAGRDGRRSVAILLRDLHPDGPTVQLLDFMAARTVETASEASEERGRLQHRRRMLVREMQSLAFSRGCFRGGLLDYFGEARARQRRPISLRIVDWLFVYQKRDIEPSLCCDVCNARHSNPHRFICEALGIRAPQSMIDK
jgi:superfamily II DNA helicase RecQ